MPLSFIKKKMSYDIIDFNRLLKMSKMTTDQGFTAWL